MLSIYICVSDRKIRSDIEAVILLHSKINRYDMEIKLSTFNAEALLKKISFDINVGIYFIDVNIKHKRIDWLTLGSELRKHDPKGFIVYITDCHDLLYKTFEYHIGALDYIIKEPPFEMYDSIRRCLDTVVARTGGHS